MLRIHLSTVFTGSTVSTVSAVCAVSTVSTYPSICLCGNQAANLEKGVLVGETLHSWKLKHCKRRHRARHPPCVQLEEVLKIEFSWGTTCIFQSRSLKHGALVPDILDFWKELLNTELWCETSSLEVKQLKVTCHWQFLIISVFLKTCWLCE